MLGLSLWQPWCWSIFDPIADKGVENRSWPPPPALIGQTIAIHAAMKFDEQRAYSLWDHHITGTRTRKTGLENLSPIGYFLALGITHAPALKERYEAGVIVGVATIERVVTDATTLPPDQKRWFFGDYGWVLANRRQLPEPVPHKGKQGLWKVLPAAEDSVRAQLGLTN